MFLSFSRWLAKAKSQTRKPQSAATIRKRFIPQIQQLETRLAPATLSTLYSFTGSPSHGANPYAGLIADANGDLFGTTQHGGASGDGTVFELVRSGSTYTTTILHAFTRGSDGAFPQASLIEDVSGDLFGTTANGGAADAGTVFELVKSGSSYTYTVLHFFTNSTATGPPPTVA